jgi:DNA-directed RNA polymerase subunit RPC12/RpoP
LRLLEFDSKEGLAMPMTFNCPNCGAQLEYQGGDTSLVCQYCGNSVVVPADLQEAHAEEEVRKIFTWAELRKNRWFQVGVALFFVIFVLPTCIGVIGSLLGIVAGVGAPIFAFILQFLLRR